ncbi:MULTISPECIES: hypothetical protein [unclassified Cyanobium]|uniref:hypothetical protein n=1 Tax=unclassified Cyanobium TaxID=2627006 RepID=UPI0020CC3DA5|nr:MULTISPECIES: hypothetical protein [unclassified Cyanobium]MCP9859053.1 hypothetical protein [Cyanobium sp. Cruz-8H5]MCP9866343.1 hypothetical protein [Cyanobium sp. Cruz-8D1]
MSPLRLLAVLLLIACCRPARAQPLAPPPLAPPAPPPRSLLGPDGPDPRDRPPPLAPPSSVIAPINRPDARLEAALRARLFAGPVAASPAASGDPDQTEWEQARATAQRPACADVGPLRYLHNRIDLDGDGRLETVAVVVGSFACASGGCSLLVFRDVDGALELVAESGLFQSPLKVISNRHRGWLDLTLPASLHGAPDGVMELRFDGRTYQPVPLPGTEGPASGPPGTVVLELLPLPFERLGHPLPCGP